jgi:hypothetical protein
MNIFFTSALLKVIDQLHASAALSLSEVTGAQYIGGWADPRAGVDDVKKGKSFPYRDSNCNPYVRP